MSLQRAVTPLQCTNPDCTLAAGGVCARAGQADPVATCPDLVRTAAPPADERDDNGMNRAGPALETTHAHEPTSSPSSYAAPWSGRHLSESEADRLMRSSPARVVGVVGPHGAGKTCLLTSLFLQLADGKCAALPYRFASSRSLFAFQTLGQELSEWDGESDGQMVRHTAKSEGPERGAFLHLGLRPRDPRDDRIVDLLLCDIAGEYFERFASVADADTRERMAFLHRCDAFILVVDGPALVSAAGPRLDADLARMFGRLVGLLHDRIGAGGTGAIPPIFIVVSKADDMPEETCLIAPETLLAARARRIARTLEQARDAGIPCEVRAVRAIPKSGPPQGVSELFGQVLGAVDARTPWPPIQARLPEPGFAAFLAHRGWSREP